MKTQGEAHLCLFFFFGKKRTSSYWEKDWIVQNAAQLSSNKTQHLAMHDITQTYIHVRMQAEKK